MRSVLALLSAAFVSAITSSTAAAHYYRGSCYYWVQTGPYYGQGYWRNCGYATYYPSLYYDPYYYPYHSYYPRYHYDPYYRPGIYFHFEFSPRRHHRRW